MTFEYDLGNFVYDSIWLNMMYIIEKHCLKWFPSQLSHVNIQNTLKYDEILWKKTKMSKNFVFSISIQNFDSLQSS